MDGTEAEYNGERTVEGISKCKLTPKNITAIIFQTTQNPTKKIQNPIFTVLTTDGVYGLAAPDSEPTAVRDEL